MMKNPYLESWLQSAAAVSRDFSEAFGTLTESQLNWKPDEKRWSIAQCIEHLIHTNELYLVSIQQLAEGTYRPTLWERISPFSSLWTRLFRYSMQEKARTRVPAPAAFRPHLSAIDPGVIPDLVHQQAVLMQAVRNTDHLSHQRTTLASPVTGWVTFRLNGLIQMLLSHEKRHFHQAQAVKEQMLAAGVE